MKTTRVVCSFGLESVQLFRRPANRGAKRNQRSTQKHRTITATMPPMIRSSPTSVVASSDTSKA